MRLYYVLMIAVFLTPARIFGQAERNMLTGRFDSTALATAYSPDAIRQAWPAYSDRARWASLDGAQRLKLIEAGETALPYVWKTVPATTYLEFVKTGNRYIMEDIYNQNVTALKQLVFAELAEGKERFLPQIINGVWALCEVSSWSISASIGLQRKGPGLPDINEPIVELGAGITANVMAWTYFLFRNSFDKQSPLIAQRIKQEIDRRILQPYYTRSDFWWMALDGKQRMVNNWNVWLNYNVLTCLLLVEDDPAKRLAGMYKTMRSVDKFINYYKEDGACEEGPAYWSHAGGMLYNYLSLLQQATGGKIDLFHEPLIKNIGSYIGKAFIDSNYYLNYADAAARLTVDAGLVYLYGKATGDEQLTGFGSYLAHQQGWQRAVPVETLYGGLRNLFMTREVLQVTPHAPYMAAAWMPQTGIALARDHAGSAEGFYFSALAGHNEESHNHNDVGTCVLFYNGRPVLIDIGSGTYTGQTFGPDRYSIWTMRSAFHNVPLINGMEQKEGRTYEARMVQFKDRGPMVSFSVDIAAAYPVAAGVRSWTRAYSLQRGRSFTISDDWKLEADKGGTALHFMTSASVEVIREGLLRLITGNDRLELSYDPKKFSYSIASITVDDKKLLVSWPPVVYRLVFTKRDDQLQGQHRIVIRKAY
ncbi:heparinase II/III domain-containing protein [Paraflavitalea pollutisoli]|uniref:heparinase II/III domain-containing protein n=1 Tax=Paraflavitalea pollutisoli TaxID=3034143 RepID=UPI0023EC3913|nr:heparinase II/III family protein [Paraflavitalea sp. H1-2-19X]